MGTFQEHDEILAEGFDYVQRTRKRKRKASETDIVASSSATEATKQGAKPTCKKPRTAAHTSATGAPLDKACGSSMPWDDAMEGNPAELAIVCNIES